MKTRADRPIASLSTLLALFALLVACSSSEEKKELSVDDYDQTCNVDTDCIIIDIGACECSCAKAVINVKDHAKFEQDLSQCDTGGNQCGMCPWMGSTSPFCNAGKCDSKAVGADAGTD